MNNKGRPFAARTHCPFPFFIYHATMSSSPLFTLLPVTRSDLKPLSDLCLRSKGHWGYGADFLAACRPALTLTAQDLYGPPLIMAKCDGQYAGIAQLEFNDGLAGLGLLFVDPAFMGSGCGRTLFQWCVAEARKHGAKHLLIEADPEAVPFYKKMGARQIGTVPSGVIKDRDLPLLERVL